MHPGEKGIGKSILTPKVLADLSMVNAATTVFVTVDCRPLRSQRDVYREVASQLVDDLTNRRDVSEALKAEARAFDTLTRFDEISLRNVHEHLMQHSAGFDLGGRSSLFKLLESKFGISVKRTKKNIETLEGTVNFDGHRLREMLIYLLQDIHIHAKLRADIEALLHLSEAPLILVLNMRTYYASVLTRRISKRHALGRLATDDHLEIFARRMQGENQANQAKVADAGVQRAVRTLAELARTPLAFLVWIEFVLEEGLHSDEDICRALVRRLSTRYSTLSRHVPKIAALFEDIEATAELQDVQDACGGHETIFRQLLDHQVLLPVNYWDPREFYLDPELGFLVGREDLCAEFLGD